MKCPNCSYEPINSLLLSPCPNKNCSFNWIDTEEYVEMLAENLEIETVPDIGCGNKGVIAQNYWENRKIKRGYACDRHIIKSLPDLWTPLLMDAKDLHNLFEHEKIDFVTHCGLLEHIDYESAFDVLECIEKITKQKCFFTFSAFLRDVDYKVKIDGNPYHYYKSWWDVKTIECLGYHVDWDRMSQKLTFEQEVTGWFSPNEIKTPFKERKKSHSIYH